MAAALEQLLTKLGLELGDLHAERRLYDIELARRAGDTFFFRQTKEILDLPEFHRRLPCRATGRLRIGRLITPNDRVYHQSLFVLILACLYASFKRPDAGGPGPERHAVQAIAIISRCKRLASRASRNRE